MVPRNERPAAGNDGPEEITHRATAGSDARVCEDNDRFQRRREAALRLPPIPCPRCPDWHRDPALECPPPVRLTPDKYRWASFERREVAA